MKYRILILLTFIGLISHAQNKAFDHLEHLYDQGHFKKVHKKAKYLLNKPEYDFSVVPKYYVAISGFQLMLNDKWKRNSQEEFEFAMNNYETFLQEDVGQKIKYAHQEELQFLRKDLLSWLEQNSGNNHKNIESNARMLLSNYFQTEVPVSITKDKDSVVPVPDKITPEEHSPSTSNDREELVSYAKQYIGTKYKWAGNSPKGFDCSGFTAYVLKNFKTILPRKASDQYDKSKKKKIKHVEPGDLVFFGSKSNINHVGIIVSNKNKKPVMIHSSTSKGVILTNIYDSTYWKNKVVGFGSYL